MERTQVDSKYKWRLEDVFLNDEAFEKSLDEVKKSVGLLEKYRGRLSESSEVLLEALQFESEINKKFDDIRLYALLKKDEDVRIAKYQAMYEKAMEVYNSLTKSSSFIAPEILSMDEETIKSFFKKSEGLKIYKIYIDDILNKKAHTLSENEEEFLKAIESFSSGPEKIYAGICMADMKFPNILQKNGEEASLSNGTIVKHLVNQDRDIRKQAHEKYYGTYMKNVNALANTLALKVQYDVYLSQKRKYKSSLEAAMHSENIDTEVYENLINGVNGRIGLLHRFMELRKELLGLDKQYMYDVQVPIIEGKTIEITYEDAKNASFKALECLGEEYLDNFKKGFDEASGWIDSAECVGKNPLPYSFGTYNTHPYVTMIYTGTAANASTLIHEMGHAMHYFYSYKTQPYVDSKFTIFVSEVAALMNDWLFVNYLIENTDDKKEKLQYINHLLEQFRGMFFRTTMMSEFEKIIHEKVEKGENLNADVLNSVNMDMHKKYYGESMLLDDFIAVDWARYNHMYYNFYTYKYATGLTAAVSLAKKIKSGEEGVREAYIEMLSSGCVGTPVEQLKKVGIDMTTAKPVEDALDEFERLTDEFERLVKGK